MPLRVRKRQHKRCWSFFLESNHSLSNDSLPPIFFPPPPPPPPPPFNSDHHSLTSTGAQCGEKKKKNTLTPNSHLHFEIVTQKKEGLPFSVFILNLSIMESWFCMEQALMLLKGYWTLAFVCKALALAAVGNRPWSWTSSCRYITRVPNMMSKMLWRDARRL